MCWHHARGSSVPGKFGSAVLLPNSLRSAGEAWWAGIPQRVGYARGGRGLLLTHTVPVPPRNPIRLHQRFYYLDLVTAVGGPSDAALPELRKEPVAATDSFPLVAICPGAEYGPAKRWPVENFIVVAKHFMREKHRATNRIAAWAQRRAMLPIARGIRRSNSLRPRTCAGKTSLAEFMAALALVPNRPLQRQRGDACGLRVGRADGCGLWFHGAATDRADGRARTTVLRHHVACSPCFLRECPIDFRCMKGDHARGGHRGRRRALLK